LGAALNKHFHRQHMHLPEAHQQPPAELPAAQAGHHSRQAEPRLSSRRPGASFHKDFHHQHGLRLEAHQQLPAASQAAQVGHHPRQAGPLPSSWRSGAAFHKPHNCSPRAELDHKYTPEPEQPKC
jgi:hypothetical protein